MIEIKRELVRVLEVRVLSNFERRKRRLQAIPLDGLAEAIEKARKGLPLTPDQYILANLGFLPGEREKLEQKSNQPD